MKFLKTGLYSLAVIVLLLIIGVTIFISTFDANEYRAWISEQVKQQTGREFTLGDIKPSVFPWLGLELQQVSLHNAQGFESAKMLQIESIDVRVEFFALLKQELRVDTLRIHGLALNLEKDKQGKTNWDDILEKQARPASTPSQSTTTQDTRADKERKQAASEPLAALMINGLEIKDADIKWRDELTAQTVALQKFNLTSGAIGSGEMVPVKMSALVKLKEPAVDLKIDLDAGLAFDLQGNNLELEKLNLVLDADLAEPDLKKISLTLRAKLDANLKTQHFVLPAYNLDIDVQGDALPNGQIKANLKGDADVDLQKQIASIKQITLSSSELTLQSQLTVSHLLAAPNVRGQFKLLEFNPAQLAKKLAIDLPKSKSADVLKNANLEFSLIASEKALELNALKLKLDNTTVLADVKIENFEKPVINYSINMDQFDLDSYLPPPVKEVPADKQASIPAATANAKARVDVPIDLPVELLRTLDVDGILNIKTLIAFEQSINDLKIKVSAKQGLVKVPVLNASLLKGSVHSSAQLDVRKGTPLYSFKLKGSGLEGSSLVNPILQDMLAEKSVSMSGATNLNADITSSGNSVNQLMAGSNGRFDLNMSEAKLHGVDVEYFVRKGVVEYLQEKQLAVPDAWRSEYKPKETTALKVAKASAIIKNGVVENNDLLLDSSRFKISGAGIINLPKEKLDYRVVINLHQTKTVTTSDKLLAVPMPVSIKGGFAQPKIGLDSKVWRKSVGSELKSAAKKEVKKKVDEEKEVIKEKVKDKLKDKFKGLFR